MKRSVEEKFRQLGGIVPVGDSFAPLTKDEIDALETELGETLPEDYRQFLSTYGECSFGELVEFEPIEALPMPISDNGRGPVSFFYGSAASPNSLAKEITAYAGRMPETMIPIGDDCFGNQICLGISGDERGKVYYWDHENEWDEQDYLEEHGEPMPPELKFQNVYLIADSFEDFVRRLKTYESA